MKKETFLTIVAFSFAVSTNLFGQQTKNDSLKIILKNKTEKVDSLNKEGRSFINALDITQGIKEVKDALVLSKQIKYDKGIADALNHLGVANLKQDNNLEAMTYFQKSLSIREKILDKKGIAGSINNIGNAYRKLNNYSNALNNYRKFLELSEELVDSNYLSIAFDNIGSTYRAQCNYNRALEYGLLALKINEGMNYTKGIAKSSNDIADIYDDIGNYTKSLEYNKQSLKISQENLYKEQEAGALNDIGSAYLHMSIYPDALKSFFQALKIRKEILDTTGIAQSSNNIGAYYDLIGNYSEAMNYYEGALKIQEQRGDKSEIAKSLNNIGIVYYEKGDYKNALDYYLKGLKIQEAIPDKNGMAGCYVYIGNLYTVQGNYDTAIQYLRKATNIWEKELLMKESPDYALALDYIGNNYRELGQLESAISFSHKSFNSTKSFLLNNIALLTEKQKVTLINTVANNSNDFFSNAFLNKSAQDSTIEWLYDYQLFNRGLVLESSSGLAASIQNDSLSKELWDNFTSCKKIIDEEGLKPASKRRQDLSILKDSADALEGEIRERAPSYNKWQDKVSTTWRDVQTHLAENEAAIEFVYFQLDRKEKTDSVYAALVLAKTMQYPKLIYLCEQKQLEPFWQNTGRDAESLDPPISASLVGDSLYKLIMQPLMPYLNNIKSIAFAPDGLLHKINMAEISGPDGELLCKNYQLRQMLSTRSVVFPSPEPAYQPATFFGGIDYKYIVPSDSSSKEKILKNSALASANAVNNRRSGFGPLPHSKEEVDSLSNLYKSKSFSYAKWEDTTASENKFKQMDGNSPAVLHIATHGFYFPPWNLLPAAEQPDENSKSIYSIGYSIADEPLLRSGLALAGADSGRMNPGTLNAGLLYAVEISRLDLSNTGLVVLSACKSARGDIEGSEGVYGLQRAFKMAGVKYIIMSLWDVDDEASKKFMESFYGKWLGGQPIHAAFQKTQQEMADEYKYDALKWAAFVLVE